jgi:diguanylate cyclase (GGDEF)-like protein
MLFLPVTFASLAYPVRLVALVAFLAELAFAGLVAVGAPDPGYVVVVCSAMAGSAGLAVWQAANHDAWRDELARSSTTDPLTGLLNRRGFAMATHAAFSALDRHGRPMTLLILDLDVFKAYNDTYGHQAGDELLQQVGQELLGALRPTDAVARFGGDEFVILLNDTGCTTAEPVILRMEAALRARAPHCLGRASAPEDGSMFDELYRAADKDLYERKVLSRVRAALHA